MIKMPNSVFMGTQNRIRTANDNAPLKRTKLYALGRNQFAAANNIDQRLSPTPRLAVAHARKSPQDFLQNSADHKTTESLKISLLIWGLALIMTLVLFAFGASTAPKMLTSLAVFWTGLWSSYVAVDYGHWRLSELSIISAIGGLMGAIMLSLNYFGVGLTLIDALMLICVLPLILGAILKSRISVLTSICASLIWAALSFTGFAEPSRLMLIFPFIFAAQIYLGTKIRSGLAVTLSVITAYYWLASFVMAFWSTGDLPLTFASVLLFSLGTLHHRAGKASEDARLTGSSVHIYTGWIAAIIGAIGFQYFWLNPDAIASSTAILSAAGLALWKAVIGASLIGIFISGLVRYKYSQMSLASIFMLTLTCSLMPLMLWFPQWPQNMAANMAGLSAVPTIGIFIGATICASALGMALNGIRRHSRGMIAMALATLIVQAFLLIKPEHASFDNSVTFIIGMIIALVVSGAIAGKSLAHQAPAPRFKYS